MTFTLRHALLPILVALGLLSTLPAQAQSTCGSDELLRIARQRPDGPMREAMVNAVLRQRVEALRGERGGDEALLIPVVVHIIHDNGPENISDAQVLQGIAHLNQAFANSGPYQQANGVDIGVQFCMAQQDTAGMPTTGITRTVSALTDLISETNDAALKQLIRWDPTQYLNIWLVNSITSVATGPAVAGYAYFPNSHGGPEDGIVNEAALFGSTSDNSKVHIHEAGHYLGLYHTFEGGCANNDCLAQGDRVCDTPPDGSTQAVLCGNNVNTCSTDEDDTSANNPFRAITLGGLGAQSDLYQDYMDYGFQTCQDRFTAGQRERMRAALLTARASLLNSPGCSTGCGISIINLGVQDNSNFVYGMSWTIAPELLGVSTVSYNWQVDGSTVSTSPEFNVSLLPFGAHVLTLVLTNTAGACSVEHSINVNVSCSAPVGLSRDPLHPEPGQTVTFGSTEPEGATVQWVVDGVITGTGPLISQTFPEPGYHSAYVVSNNGGCTDTSTVLGFMVGSCPSAYDRNWNVNGPMCVSFLTEPPRVDFLPSTPQFFHNEGTATLSDSHGDVIIYSNGVTVWDRTRNMMQNGDSLLGGLSSAQSSLIVPNPSNNGIHYLFTTGHQAGLTPDGADPNLRYNVIDLALNNGNGAVTEKNILLMGPTTEKLAAVKHCNGHDVWVVAHQFDSDAFYSYLITDEGLNTTPLIQHVGKVHLPSYVLGPGQFGNSAIGTMKFSQQADKLALASSQGEGFAEVFEFDAETGAITNPITIRDGYDTAYFAVEFSPNGQNLYLTTESGFNPTGRIYQYGLSNYDSLSVAQSRAIVAWILPGIGIPTLILAPDDNIYVGINGAFHKMDDPDGANGICGFDYNDSFSVPGLSLGVNNTVTRNRPAERISASGPLYVCNYTEGVQYTIDRCAHPANTYWIYNGPNTVVGNTYDTFTLDFEVAGMDTLIAVRDNYCEGLYMDTLFIQVDLQLPLLANDTALCAPLSTTLSAAEGYASYLWQDGSTGNTLDIDGPGTYTLTVSALGGCTLTDAIVVSEFPNDLELSLGPDITMCFSANQELLAPSDDLETYLWSNGSTTSSTMLYYQYATDTIWLRVTDANGCAATDSIVVTPQYDGPQFTIGPDTTVCPEAVLVLQPSNIYGSVAEWRWEDGSPSSTHAVWQPGTYWLTGTSPCGYFWTDSVTVTLCDLTNGITAFATQDIRVMPNPTAGSITLALPETTQLLGVEVLDMVGQVVLRQTGASRTVDLSSMSAGLYTIRLNTSSGLWTARVVRE